MMKCLLSTLEASSLLGLPLPLTVRFFALLRPVPTEINGQLQDFCRLVVHPWIVDNCLNVFRDDNHMRDEKYRTSENEPIFLAHVFHLLSH